MNAERVSARVAKPTLSGQVSQWLRQRLARWLAPKGPDYQAAGSYRYLARQIDIDLPCADGGRTILFSSPVEPAAGNNAVLLFSHFLREELGCRILLIDGTLRDDGVGAALGFCRERGFIDLAGGSTLALDGNIRPTRNSGISVMPAGRLPDRPMRPFEFERIAELFRELRTAFDYILIQQGPIFADSRYLDFTCEADLIMMLVEEGGTPIGDLELSMRILQDHQISNVRVVLTTPT